MAVNLGGRHVAARTPFQVFLRGALAALLLIGLSAAAGVLGGAISEVL